MFELSTGTGQPLQSADQKTLHNVKVMQIILGLIIFFQVQSEREVLEKRLRDKGKDAYAYRDNKKANAG